MKNQNNLFSIVSIFIGLIMMFSVSCKKNKNLPTITTASISDVTISEATTGGEIIEDGGKDITIQGICWALTKNPTIENNTIEDNLGTDIFTINMIELTANTTYYVRAFATNKIGTGYGDNRLFTTLENLNDTVFTDQRDGTIYKTKAIGNQIWMVENLKYLPNVVGSAISSVTVPYYYVYDYEGTDINTAKSTANYMDYGVLYNWESAKVSCPDGWHLPTDDEWTELENHLANNGQNFDGTSGGGGDKIAKSMASSNGWATNGNNGAVGNTDYPQFMNKSGFTGLPGGFSFETGYSEIGTSGLWWSSTEQDVNSAKTRALYNDFSSVLNYGGLRKAGFSVRCVRD